jgi:hypothetical protein
MSYKNKLLSPGLAYCEVQSIDDIGKDGQELKSRNGEPMLRIKVKVVDLKGESTNIWDYVVLTANWKIHNIQNGFNVSNLVLNGQFNKSILFGKCAACSIKNEVSEQYGESTKIDSYIPLEFVKLASNVGEKNMHPNVDMGLPPGIKGTTSGAASKLFEGAKVILEDDDDIPF